MGIEMLPWAEVDIKQPAYRERWSVFLPEIKKWQGVRGSKEDNTDAAGNYCDNSPIVDNWQNLKPEPLAFACEMNSAWLQVLDHWPP